MSVIHFWNRSICDTRLFLKVHYFSKRILLKGEFNFKLLRIITFFCFPKLQLLTLFRVIDLSKSEYIFPFKHPTAEATWLVNSRYSALKGSRPFFLETIDFFLCASLLDIQPINDLIIYQRQTQLRSSDQVCCSWECKGLF